MLLISGYLCNAQEEGTSAVPPTKAVYSPPKGHGTFPENPTPSPEVGTHQRDPVPGLFFKLLLPSNPEPVLPSGVQV